MIVRHGNGLCFGAMYAVLRPAHCVDVDGVAVPRMLQMRRVKKREKRERKRERKMKRERKRVST